MYLYYGSAGIAFEQIPPNTTVVPTLLLFCCIFKDTWPYLVFVLIGVK